MDLRFDQSRRQLFQDLAKVAERKRDLKDLKDRHLNKLSGQRREIGILLPNNQRQHRTLHIQKDVLPYALC